MLPTRALAVLAAVGCAAALLSACERSATAPLAPRMSVAPSSIGLALAPADEAAATSGLLDFEGGMLELAARPGYPLHSTLTVPAGILDVPAYFDVSQQASGTGLTLRVSSRPVEQVQAAAGFTRSAADEPIVLVLRNDGGEPRDITVVFSPPDGAEPVLARASLHAGQATTLGFRRGRSKYSVIYF